MVYNYILHSQKKKRKKNYFLYLSFYQGFVIENNYFQTDIKNNFKKPMTLFDNYFLK